MEKISLKIPANAKYFSSLRLFLSGILTGMNFDIDKIEDLKMALSECLNVALKLDCKENIEVEFTVWDDKIKIQIGDICKKNVESLEEISLPLMIVECLVDKCEIEDESLIITAEV
ncbi:MAG: anti-sigma factor [Peptoniphilus sp.]|nr:anti-sigma factor [Peptoniphilus sp.]